MRDIIKMYYNMTVCILARNDINFSMAAGLIRLHMPGVQLLLSKAKSQLSFKFSDLLWICFIMVGLLLTYLNMPILKACGSASRAQHPLTTGIVRQFPLLRNVFNLQVSQTNDNGRNTWNVSPFKHICAFYMKITNIHGVKFENVML